MWRVDYKKGEYTCVLKDILRRISNIQVLKHPKILEKKIIFYQTDKNSGFFFSKIVRKDIQIWKFGVIFYKRKAFRLGKHIHRITLI